MSHTIHVIFDGEVFRPEESVPLKPNTRYRVTVEEQEEQPESSQEAEHPLTAIARLATDMGVTDLAERHDYYARRRKLGL